MPRIYLEIVRQRKRVNQKIRALKLACEFITERTGSCPGDIFDWENPNDCEKECSKIKNQDERLTKCWFLYFEEQSKKGNKTV